MSAARLCIFLVFDPMYERLLIERSFSLIGSKPILERSLLSAHSAVRRAAALSFFISLYRF
jgi:hypothetical protein